MKVPSCSLCKHSLLHCVLWGFLRCSKGPVVTPTPLPFRPVANYLAALYHITEGQAGQLREMVISTDRKQEAGPLPRFAQRLRVTAISLPFPL
jgi:hypothetical protein